MMMGISYLLFALMLLLTIHSSLSLTKCKNHELEALIKFKHSFSRDPQRLLSSWVGNDCCHWRGVSCDNVTGDVIKLNLRNSQGFTDYPSSLVSSELSSALLELKFLTHLDLSFNDFTRSRIPKFLGSMSKLRYLNFSNTGFYGTIPLQLGNLTNLMHLDLRDDGDSMLYTQERLVWLSGLSKLQSLDMSSMNMSQSKGDTLQALFGHPTLLALSLSNCLLPNTHLSELLITNTSTLQHIDLSNNNFEGPFPYFPRNLLSLQSLSLACNSFSGHFPLWLTNMRRLEYLDLSLNYLNGKLPSQLGQLPYLNYLDLSYNGFQGRLPTSLAKLSALKHLDLSNNEFHGQAPASLAKLFALRHLDLSNNGLSGLMPDILGYLSELERLDISSNSIQGTVSHFGNLSKLSFLNLNFNNIKLNISTNWRPLFQLKVLRAHSCEINMAFHQFLSNQTQLEDLDLSYTGISGELPQWLWNLTTLFDLQLAGNKLTGSLPSHITCDGCNLDKLDLHNNMLSGTIPHWLKHLKTIRLVDLSENLLSGRVFEGQNNSSLLSGSNSLLLLDLSDNMFYGEIQVKNISLSASLVILSLRSNDFSKFISSQLCQFTHLAILELAHNRLTGHISSCLGALLFENSFGYVRSSGIEIQEIIKGTTKKFLGTMRTHSIIDLSCNHLVGTIPEELTNKSKLMQLNLSSNHLTGGIPDDIGNLELLESLDLSNNNLSGTIPQSLSAIPWLSVLNLSNNNLRGPIPTGSQLQTLDDPSIYAGNSGLCGVPLPDKCSKPNSPLSPTDDDHGAEKDDEVKDNRLDKLWLYLAVMSGVATGFWGVIGTLVFKKSWRHAYFRFVEETADKIYVPVKIRVNKFKNRQRNVVEI